MVAFRSPINLQIPEVPAGIPDEWVPIFQGIYNALRNLQSAIGDFSGSAYALDPDYFKTLAPVASASLQIQNMQLLYIEATETITKGQLVNLFLSGGVLKCRRSDATAIGTRAWGYAMQAMSNGVKGMVALQGGYNNSFGGLTIGATYYVSASTPGGITVTPPAASATIIQEVGIALSATELAIHLSKPIVNP